jgi:hypothetical protein
MIFSFRGVPIRTAALRPTKRADDEDEQENEHESPDSDIHVNRLSSAVNCITEVASVFPVDAFGKRRPI